MKFIDLDRPVAFLDLEASGLHATSYPIEVGWAYVDLAVESMLIRPLPSWGLEDWSLQSERIHNISRDLLIRNGTEAVSVARRLNEALAGRLVLTDAPRFDGHWLAVLYRDAGVSPSFGLDHYTGFLHLAALRAGFTGEEDGFDTLLEHVDARYPHLHRAGPDALQMAARWKAICDERWREELRRKK